ncbi:MAG TPA: hypothetical protein PLH54_07980 [Syntrophales bacterium]|jgi:hypothetical protein|nr:hypothetical protein [Syntrophales bacterium]HQI34822.1 hypothetical protein [Syntrophales bacterium]HQJ30313.1 hypothetical protein [Syntrophales bacterium]HRR46276.1 hypothetical protein [Syntrophales bacterium]HRU87656.1 hypothetical protein [Syntrophales bacterium]
MSDITRYDHMEIRCPKLGHELTFAYCRREGGELPCARVVRCWEGLFPVAGYFREILSPEVWEAFHRRTPPDKMVSLLELIAQAEARKGQ